MSPVCRSKASILSLHSASLQGWARLKIYCERIAAYRRKSPFYRQDGLWIASRVMNKQKAEGKLLRGWNPMNIQRCSNAPPTRGTVYGFIPVTQ